jgi:hypothetical protein
MGLSPAFRVALAVPKMSALWDITSYSLNYWVMDPVARVSINIVYRNLRTQQMSVLVLLCTFYTTCFGYYID